MNEEVQKQDDEISLIDLFGVLWRRKVMIIVITLTAAIGVVTFSVVSLVLPPETSPLPNQYTPKALMLIDNKSSGGGSMLGGMGGLAALAGVSLPVSASYSDLAVYLIGTNSLLDSVVDEFDLITRYKIEKSPRAESRKALRKSLQADYDTSSGVLAISFTATDPVFAKDVVDYCTAYLAKRFDELGLDKNRIEKENLEANIATTFEEILQLEEESRRLERSVTFGSSSGGFPAITTEVNRIALELGAKRQIHTQLKVQYEMLKVSMASEKPIFQILEMAEVPDQKSKPSRGMLCIIVTFAAGFFSVFLAFVLNAVANIKNDPEAMAKLRGKSEQ
jgi:uncharacterized protein involved in exopolysaccharide biosynthesis